MENPPFEDVFPIQDEDFPLLCLFTGGYTPPKNERMSPENQWLVQMYFLLKIVPFKETLLVFRGVVLSMG